MRTIITTDYGESRVIFGKYRGDPESDCHYVFWADVVGGPRKQGLTSRERSGHPKHGLGLELEFRGLESNQRPPRSERGVTTTSNCPGFGKEDSNLHPLIQSQGAY